MSALQGFSQHGGNTAEHAGLQQQYMVVKRPRAAEDAASQGRKQNNC